MRFLKRKLLVAISASLVTGTTMAADVLTGIPALACEAILCLSSGARPSECSPSLSHYFGINHKFWSDTVADRLNFLNQCPAVSDPTQNMSALVRAISRGAGRCDAEYLNSHNTMTLIRKECDGGGGDAGQSCTSREVKVVKPEKPAYCSVYDSHEYTYKLNVRYVGTPTTGGLWAEPDDYEAALTEYNARLARLEAEQNLRGGKVTWHEPTFENNN